MKGFDAIRPRYDCFYFEDNFRWIAQWVFSLSKDFYSPDLVIYASIVTSLHFLDLKKIAVDAVGGDIDFSRALF